MGSWGLLYLIAIMMILFSSQHINANIPAPLLVCVCDVFRVQSYSNAIYRSATKKKTKYHHITWHVQANIKITKPAKSKSYKANKCAKISKFAYTYTHLIATHQLDGMSIQYHQVTCSQPPTRNLFLPGAALNVTHAFATCGTGFIWLTIWHAGNGVHNLTLGIC